MQYGEFIDRAYWPELDSENCREFLTYLGNSPLVESGITDELVWIKTGIEDNSKNGVLRTRTSESGVDSLVEEVSSRFSGIAYQWIVTRACQPENLGQKLVSHRFIDISGGVSMTMELPKTTWASSAKITTSAKRLCNGKSMRARFLSPTTTGLSSAISGSISSGRPSPISR